MTSDINNDGFVPRLLHVVTANGLYLFAKCHSFTVLTVVYYIIGKRNLVLLAQA